MMQDWISKLNGDPTEWLLQPENPPIRYWTLIDIVGQSPNNPEVHEAQESLKSYQPVLDLLNAQKPGGYWIDKDYYLPRTSHGTLWVLSVLGDLGLTRAVEQIERACEFMFSHQRESGAFCRRRRVSGKGWVWQEDASPCTHARIVRFLIQLGYSNDPRVQKAIDWLLSIQRNDGMWFCRRDIGNGCLRATIDVLRIAALDTQLASLSEINRAAAAVRDLLLEPRMSRYHVGENWGTWESLKYPYFGFSVISALDALIHLDFTLEDNKISTAWEYLLSRQLPDGAWPLDDTWPSFPFDFGVPGQANKWLTLDAMRVGKKLLCN